MKWDDQWSPETTETRVRKERSDLIYYIPYFYKKGVLVCHINTADNSSYRSRNYFKIKIRVSHLLVRLQQSYNNSSRGVTGNMGNLGKWEISLVQR